MKIAHSYEAAYAHSSQLCQRDITALQQISSSWDLCLNQEKCVVMHFQSKVHSLPPPIYSIGDLPIRVVHSHPDLGVLVDSSPKFHDHTSSTVHEAIGLSQNLLKSTVCRSPDFMFMLLRIPVRPVIECCLCVWHTGYLGDLRALESVQRCWTKCIEGMSSRNYQCCLRILNLYFVHGRLLRADMIQCWKMFLGKCAVSPTELLTLAPESVTRGHRFKVCHPRPHTDVRQRPFSVRCVRLWNSRPGHVVTETDFHTFKGLLADALGDLLYEHQ